MYSSTTIHIKNLSANDIKTLNLLSSMIAELYNNCINFIKSNYENDNYIPDDVSLYREMSKTTAFSNLGKSYVYTLNVATQNSGPNGHVSGKRVCAACVPIIIYGRCVPTIS